MCLFLFIRFALSAIVSVCAQHTKHAYIYVVQQANPYTHRHTQSHAYAYAYNNFGEWFVYNSI